MLIDITIKNSFFKKPYPFQTKTVNICTLFQTKTAKKPYPFGAAHTFFAYIRPEGGHKSPCCMLHVRRSESMDEDILEWIQITFLAW